MIGLAEFCNKEVVVPAVSEFLKHLWRIVPAVCFAGTWVGTMCEGGYLADLSRTRLHEKDGL